MPLLMSPSRAAALALPAAALALLLPGCGAEKKPVCVGTPQRLVIVAMTSPSDLQSSRRLAPPVTEQAIERAVTSCGSLTVGLVQNSAADVVLHTVQFKPKKPMAINARPQRRRMTKDAAAFVKKFLLDPLARQDETSKSPFFSVAHTVRDDLQAHDIAATALIITGDAVFVDVSPSGKPLDARNGPVDEAALDEFVPELKGLPKCGMIIGASLDSKLHPNLLSATDRQLTATFAKAGVAVRLTPSSDLPTCTGPRA